MPLRGGLEWLRARDPGLRAVRRSARVTLVACTGFYAARYGLGNHVAAVYALFGAIATGGMSFVPGTPRERARTLLAVLPVAAALVTLGTVLGVHSWTAALGMFGVGFLVSYAGVGAPRLGGLAGGLQALYILACFPPYAPATLGARLAGLATGIVLMAAAEMWLMPDRPPGRYADRLARAAAVASRTLRALAAESRSPPFDSPERLMTAAQELRMSRVPDDERPTSASARHRALCQGAAYMRHLLAQTWQLEQDARDTPGTRDPAAARLLQASATACHGVALGLSGRGPAPSDAPYPAAASDFEAQRVRLPMWHPNSAAVVRGGAIALDIAYTGTFLVTAVRIALGAPVPADTTPPAERPGPFWYAGRPALSLYARRLQSHLTPRSVYFQNAVRIALALSTARLIVGGLDLGHGIWALLATITVMGTSATGTRTALWPAFCGTLAGAAVVAAMLYFVADHVAVYAVVLPPLYFLAFSAGPVLGMGWNQAFSTIAAAAAFAQLGPAQPGLAAVRFTDVVIGGVTGAVVGLLAWPQGGAGELRRACSRLLDQSTRAITEIIDTIAGDGTAGDALARARLAQVIAEASYAQYATERGDPDPAHPADKDWMAILLAGNRVITMGQSLLDHCPPGVLAAWPPSAAHLRDAAHRLRLTALPLMYDLRSRKPCRAPVEPPAPDVPPEHAVIADICAASDGRAPDPMLYYAVDAAIWLASLQRLVTAISPSTEGRTAAQG
ncbi:FUSC family protein [Streptomyces sp. NBC_00365]|uniref:FUSC family protein n=1 Tax=Streptomyces sp. NBC_00365 TaxID=2975726 RepID=UPI002254C043|nr:FUSC family protein [Streptomyces sp. NBC_00365]MCX5095706.1 FUSC family protein [Streptomyces sp. NBC_00365]